MKTAMQELIEAVNQHYSNPSRGDIFDTNPYLEKEKEQIKDAWDAGMSEGIGTMMADLDWDGEFINYFNETYNQNK
jgi:hypothetical protein